MPFEKLMGGEDHARSADAALRPTFFEEALLDGVKLLVDDETFDGSDLCAFGLQNGNKTGIDQFAVHQDGAGSALTFAAAFLSAGEMQIFAEDIEKPLHRRSLDSLFVFVDGALDSAHAVVSLKMGPATAGSRDSEAGSG